MSELYHHGILGMKWGIRRFQNKDGTYTNAGRRHRADTRSDDAKSYDNLRKKKPSEMSTKELREYNERTNQLKQYRNNKSLVKKGMIAVAATAATIGTLNAVYSGSGQLLKNGKEAVGFIMDHGGREAASFVMNTVTDPFTLKLS